MKVTIEVTKTARVEAIAKASVDFDLQRHRFAIYVKDVAVCFIYAEEGYVVINKAVDKLKI